MNQVLNSQVLVQVFSLSPSAMRTLADTLRGEAMKKINQVKDEGNRNRAARDGNKAVPLDQREMLHRWIDLLNADSLPDVEWIIKQYAARDLNRQHAEERAQQPATAAPR